MIDGSCSAIYVLEVVRRCHEYNILILKDRCFLSEYTGCSNPEAFLAYGLEHQQTKVKIKVLF